MARMIFNEEHGYHFISDSGIHYELMEGKSLGGSKGSTYDIVFIMLCDANFNLDDYVVGWFFGASLFGKNKEEDFKMVCEYVEDFEKKNHLKREAECDYTGGGIYVSFVPLSDGKVLVVGSEDEDGVFAIYKGFDDDGNILEYNELCYDELMVATGCITNNEALYSEEVVNAYAKAIAMMKEQGVEF